MAKPHCVGSLTDLPIEILRRILKEACGVPGAFEYHVIDPELHETPVADRIKESMVTKCAISLVSKSFHLLAEEHLYEIIQLRSIRHIRPLVETLRLPSGTNGLTKGWWCRRLEVDLCLTHPVSEGVGAWSWGCISLWGLVTVCSHLTDLRCSMFYRNQGPETFFDVRAMAYPLSLPLSQIIATRFGASLRYLQFGGNVTMEIPLAIGILSHMSNLEVCHLSDFHLMSDTEIERRAKTWEFNRKSFVPRFPHGCENEDENEEYMAAAREASWPNATRRSIELPRLRDLQLSPWLSIVDEWKLPSLQSATDMFPEDLLYGHDHAHAVFHGLQSRRLSIIQYTHAIFRAGNTAELWDIVSHMPSLQHLRLPLSSTDPWGLLSSVHHCLRTVTLFRCRSGTRQYAIADAIDNIISNVEAGMLPNLSTVKVWGDPVAADVVNNKRARCEQLRLTLEVRDIGWITRLNGMM